LRKKIFDKVHHFKENNSRIKLSIIGISSLILCFVMVMFAYNTFAAQKNKANEEATQVSKEQKVLNTQLLDAGSYTTDEPFLEEAEVVPETEAETEAEVEATITTVIPIEQLKIATVDLSTPEPARTDEVAAPDEHVEFSSNEISKLVYGIDVSKWQGKIDWAKVKADGIDFAMIKMGGRSTGADGELYVDSYFERNIQGALANGIQVGIYFFSQAVTDQEAREEASMVVDYIRKYKITYPVAFDWESENGFRVNNYGVSKDALTSIASVFCDTVANNGYSPMVYFNKSDWDNAVNGQELTAKYKTWYARPFNQYYYTSETYQYGADLPSFRYSYQMWQYGVTNSIDGIDGYVDTNIAFFTYGNYKVDKSPVVLTVPNTTITTNVGVSVDLMKGVSATNSIGYDVTKDISIAVIDRDGDDVSSDPNYAISNPGKYTLHYRYKDPAGEQKDITVILTVRNIPTLILASSSFSYSYNNGLSAEANKDALLKLVSDNATALTYEGKDITAKTDIASKIPGELVNEIYTVIYTVDDGLGLSTTASAKVTITNVNGSTVSSAQ